MVFHKWFRDGLNFIARHAVVVLVGGISIYLLGFDRALLKTLLQIAVFEAIALLFSGLALFAYTKFDFTSLLMYGRDGHVSSVEQANVLRLLGSIFIGVHILVAVVVLGTYLGNIGV